MTHAKKFITGLALLTLPSLSGYAQGQTSDEVCKSLPENLITNVYYINGIRTERIDAGISSRNLKGQFEGRLEALRDNQEEFAEEDFKFASVYNQSGSDAVDIGELMLQKAIELGLLTQEEADVYNVSGNELIEIILSDDSGEFIREQTQEAVYQIPSIPFLNSFFDERDAPAEDEFRAEFARILAEAIAGLQNTTSQQVATYSNALDGSERVIVLAHSQGNLFANAAVELVRSSNADIANSIGGYGVASPALRVIDVDTGKAPTLGYVTARNDRVINTLRDQLGLFSVLPGNIDNGSRGDGPLNHAFDSFYIAEGKPSQLAIGEALDDLARTLEYPRVDSDSVTIRVVNYEKDDPDREAFTSAILFAFQEGGFGESDSVKDGGAEVEIDCIAANGGNVLVSFNNKASSGVFGVADSVEIEASILGEAFSKVYALDTFNVGLDSPYPFGQPLFEIEFSRNEETGELEYKVIDIPFP